MHWKIKNWRDPELTPDERLAAIAEECRGDNDPLPPEVQRAVVSAMAEASRRRRGVSVDDPDYEAGLKAEIARIASWKPENS